MKNSTKKFVALLLLLTTTLQGSTSVSWMGTTFSIPGVGESDWAGPTKVDGFLVSLGQNSLSKAGGTFALTNELDFSTSFGIKSLYYKSVTANISTAGVLRLANTDSIGWRNASNNGNVTLGVDTANNLVFNGSTVLMSSSGVIPVGSGGTNITSYTTGDLLYATSGSSLGKLNIGSADAVLTSTGTAPAWNKIVNANVDNSAAIARSKIAAGAATNVVVNDGSGLLSSTNVLGSSLGGTGHNTFTTGDSLYASSSTNLSKLAIGSTGQAKIVSGGVPAWGTVDIRGGGTGLTSYTSGDMVYAAGGNNLSKLNIGTEGQIMKVSGGAPSWGAAGATLAVTSKTATYTVTSSDDVVLAATAGGSLFLNLPSAASNSGKVFELKKTDSSTNRVTVHRAGSDTIDGLTSRLMGSIGDSLRLVSDGSSMWRVINDNIAVGCRVSGNAAASLAFQPIIFPTADYDSTSSYNTTTGGYTAPVSGYYRLSGYVSGSATVGIHIYVNGAAIVQVGSAATSASFASTVKVSAGDVIDLRPDAGYNADGASQMSIERM